MPVFKFRGRGIPFNPASPPSRTWQSALSGYPVQGYVKKENA